MKRTFTLHTAEQAHNVFKDRVWPHCKPLLMAGHRLVVTVAPETRRSAQNARLHAMLGDIAAQVPWAGSLQDAETWKRLLTAAWLRTRGEQITMLPAVDGHGVDIVFRRTSTLTVGECAELMDYIDAWGTTHGVEWSEPVTSAAEPA